MRTPINHKAVDEIIAKNFGDDREIFFETVVGFLDALPESYREFEAAFSFQNCKNMEAIAHRLKGEASLFHLPNVTEEFAKIEKMARAGAPPSPADYAKAKQALEHLKDELGVLLRARKK